MTISKWHIFPAVIAALLAGRAQDAAPDRAGLIGIRLRKPDASLLVRDLAAGRWIDPSTPSAPRSPSTPELA